MTSHFLARVCSFLTLSAWFAAEADQLLWRTSVPLNGSTWAYFYAYEQGILGGASGTTFNNKVIWLDNEGTLVWLGNDPTVGGYTGLAHKDRLIFVNIGINSGAYIVTRTKTGVQERTVEGSFPRSDITRPDMTRYTRCVTYSDRIEVECWLLEPVLEASPTEGHTLSVETATSVNGPYREVQRITLPNSQTNQFVRLKTIQ